MNVSLKVKDFLTRETWTKGTPARSQHGQSVLWDSPKACRWCVVGACLRVYGDYSPACIAALAKLGAVLYPQTGCADVDSITEWNDRWETNWEHVTRLLHDADV